MIISTKSAETMLRKALGKNQSVIAGFNEITDRLVLDPSINGEVTDVFIVTSDELRNRKMKESFLNILPNKHPKCKIIFIEKGAKLSIDQNIPGINACIIKPKAEDLRNLISQVTEDNAIEEAAMLEEVQVEEIPEFTAEDAFNRGEEDVEPQSDDIALPGYQEMDEVERAYEPEVELPVPEEEPEPVVEEPTGMVGPDLITRVNNMSNIADVTILIKEMTSDSLIKEMIDNNATYAGIEERLKTVNDAIFIIMEDKSIKTLQERLSKVRGLLHDKAALAARGDTLIEQRIVEVVDTVCAKTSKLIDEKLEEINNAIKIAERAKIADSGSARLAGLSEERLNLIIELRTMELEITRIYQSLDKLVLESAGAVSKRSIDITPDERINNTIRLHEGNLIIPEETLSAILAALQCTVDRKDKIFQELALKIGAMIKTLNKLFDLDKEIIMGYQAAIDHLHKHNVENSQVLEALKRKAVRVFVAEEGCGRTIIPYLMSYYLSRTSANVLLMDLTGTGKYESYDVMVMRPETFIAQQTEQQFLVVSGDVQNTIATGQKIVTALTKASDYYRVINVIVRPDQKELFETICKDACVINYITDMNPRSIDMCTEIMKQTEEYDVGQRVIFNKCDIAVRPILRRMGLEDRDNIQIVTFPTVPAIANASIEKFNPYGISSVSMIVEEAFRYIRNDRS